MDKDRPHGVLSELTVTSHQVLCFVRFYDLQIEALEVNYSELSKAKKVSLHSNLFLELDFDKNAFLSFHYFSFLRLFVLLEKSIIGICKEMANDGYGLSIDFSDLKGNNLDKSKNYILKYSDFEFPVKSIHWEELRDFNVIRNKIIHQDGIIPGNDVNTRKIVKKYPELEFYNFEKRIWFSRHFVVRTAQGILRFYRDFVILNKEKLGDMGVFLANCNEEDSNNMNPSMN